MIDVNFFGYGAGIVMLAWIVGMVVGSVFSILRKSQL